MELKTLKEIEYDWNNFSRQGCDDREVESVRKEAIKWYHRSDGNKHNFIRKFFNITDKDLEKR